MINTSHILTFLIILIFFSCKLQKIENCTSNKKDYELANDFLIKLKSDKVDTIIFYKRTCIGCCDFFNIYWSNKGKNYITKFNLNENKIHYKTIALSNTKIFEVLGNNFYELKNTSIKENTHIRKDSISTIMTIDHYCYSQLNIYIHNDSIITNRIKDHDFDKYNDFGIMFHNQNDKRETNDNYNSNINSKWNILLTIIENEISTMNETSNRELETLRTKKM